MKKQTTKKPAPITPYDFWVDPAVPDKQFSAEEFKAHCLEKYQLDLTKTKGTRRMMVHMDGDTWFSSQYEWTIDGHKFLNCTRDLRRGENKRIWSHGE